MNNAGEHKGPRQNMYVDINTVCTPQNNAQGVEQHRNLKLIPNAVVYLKHIIGPSVIVQGSTVFINQLEFHCAGLGAGQIDIKRKGKENLKQYWQKDEVIHC